MSFAGFGDVDSGKWSIGFRGKITQRVATTPTMVCLDRWVVLTWSKELIRDVLLQCHPFRNLSSYVVVPSKEMWALCMAIGLVEDLLSILDIFISCAPVVLLVCGGIVIASNVSRIDSGNIGYERAIIVDAFELVQDTILSGNGGIVHQH